MKDKLVGIMGGLLAMFIALLLLAPPQAPENISLPSTQDKASEGLYALHQLFKRSGIKTHSQRRAYDDLSLNLDISDSGNLLIISLPQKFSARKDENKALIEWIAQGNHVLFLCAIYNESKWSNETDLDCDYGNHILGNLGIYFASQTKDKKSEANKKLSEHLQDAIKQIKTTHENLIATRQQSLFLQVTHLSVPTRRLFSNNPVFAENANKVIFSLIKNEHNNSPVFWQTRHADSKIWISAYSNLFSNQALQHPDNAQLALNLVHQALSNDGFVIFDDFHQGLSDVYDAQAFFGDARLHTSLYFLLAFWFSLLIGRSVRLAPLSKTIQTTSAAQFIRGVGGFFARTLSDRVVFEGLLRHMFNDIRSQYGLPQNGQAVWQILEDAPRVKTADLDQLKQQVADKKKKIHLQESRNLLRNIRNSLL